MNLYDAISKVPVSTVAVVVGVFLAYRWGRTVLSWTWANKWGVLREAIALTFLAAVLVAFKAVQLPDDIPTVTLPSVALGEYKLPSVDLSGINVKAGHGWQVFFLGFGIVAGLSGLVAGICDWYQHSWYNGNQTLLRWPFGVVLTFVSPAVAILSLVFLCRVVALGG